ncbi:calcium-binding protein [Paenibacillus tepidiphilus]|uniref:calcium-binding protein n=1 Tax=Paenibacillus tepidiphilus TaxID=2608683 RepID=UPI0012391C30|nr:calcium-binding protein [Paenibacillus tepidiphilus]
MAINFEEQLQALADYYLLKSQAVRTGSGDEITLVQNNDQLSIMINGEWYRDIPIPSLEQLKQGIYLNTGGTYSFQFQEDGFVFVSENGNFIGLSRFETIEEESFIDTVDRILNGGDIDIEDLLDGYSPGAFETITQVSGALSGGKGLLEYLDSGLSVVGKIGDVVDRIKTAEDALKAVADLAEGDLLTMDPLKDLQDILSIGGLLPGKLSPLFMDMYLNGLLSVGSELLNEGRATIIDYQLRMIQQYVALGEEEMARETYPEVYELYEEYMGSTTVTDPVPYRDPVILDLDGNGIEVTAQALGAYFDFNADGFAEKGQWVKPGDGLLVRDLNGNGKVDNGRELFGDATYLKNGNLAQDGIEALLDVDNNGDRRIDAADAVFGELQVWTDLNRDGLAAAEELHSLAELGVKALDLTAVNAETLSFTFEKADGSIHQAGDLWLSASKADTLDLETGDLPESVRKLPNVRGYGQVKQLAVAMAQDAGLQALVEQFVATPGYAEQKILMEQILYKWTGSDNVSPTGRGTNIDARKLAVVEKMMNEPFVGTTGSNPGTAAAAAIMGVYEGFSNRIWVQLLKQSHLKPILERMSYIVDLTGETATIGLAKVQQYLDGLLQDNRELGVNLLQSFTLMGLEQTVARQPFEDLMLRYASRDSELAKAIAETGAIRLGTDSGDGLTGTVNRDLIFGIAGNDSISGDAGNDYLHGGEGNDNLYGNAGDDQVYGGSDNDNLYGEDGNDQLYGGDGADILYGSTGNDVLDGGAGNDTLYGELRSSSYTGLEGNDTYIFGKGYGNDTIVEGGGTADVVQLGVNPGDVEVLQESGSLVLRIKESGERLLISNYFSAAAYKVESVAFADGTVWSQTELEANVLTLGTEAGESLYGLNNVHDRMYGLAGNDSLYGYDGNDQLYGGDGSDILYGSTGNDVLDGGAGNDTLYGELRNGSYTGLEGSDTYIFGKGYGNDTIVEGGGTADVVQLGVNPGDVEVLQESGSLVLRIKESGERLLISNYFSAAAFKVESVAFADGTVWGQTELEANVLTLGTELADTLYGQNNVHDRIYGLAGNDSLHGYDGNDQLYGGDGADVLYGSTGNDVLDGGAGNDTLYGELRNGSYTGLDGNDTYIFGKGYGNDTIVEGGGTADVVQLGVNPGDVEVLQESGSLVLRIKESSERLLISNYFSAAAYKVESVTFADGTVWGQTELEANVLTLGTELADTLYGLNNVNDRMYGLAGNDNLYGYDGNDLLYGGDGADILYGSTGNDVLDGGAGNDTLYGELRSSSYTGVEGNDTYIFGKGYGNDTIVEGGGTADVVQLGVNPGDVEVLQESGSLVLRIKETGERLLISNYFSAAAYKVESVAFADGTVWGQSELEANVLTLGTEAGESLYGLNNVHDRIYGLAGNDSLYGYDGNDLLYGGDGADVLFGSTGNDVLDGGAGNDTLYGELRNGSYTGADGNDTYIFGKGYGNDTIVEGGGTADAVQLGVNPGDVEVLQESGSLVLRIKESGERLLISNYFSAAAFKVESVAFADGTVWGQSELEANVLTLGTEAGESLYGLNNVHDRIHGLAGNDSLYGYDGNDLLYGGDGADVLYGSTGNDVLDGGAGNDTLYGELRNASYTGADGNDTYIFGKGYGNDTIVEGGGTADKVELQLSYEEVIFEKSGNHLLVKISDAKDQLQISNWQSGTVYQTEVFQTNDGRTLMNTQVNQLIQAMSTFSSSAGLNWTQALNERKEEALQVLASFWTTNP